jgi:hypothetical protein
VEHTALLLPPLTECVDPIGLLPRRLVVIGAAGIVTIGVGGVVNAVAVAVVGIGIIGASKNVIDVVEHTEDATDLLDVPDHRQDVALRPDVAAGGALDLAAQDGLDGRHRHGMAVLHHDGRAVGLVQRQFFNARTRPARPSARIAGLTLLELSMPGRLAVADLVGGGCRLGGGHDGGSRWKRDGTVQRRVEERP